MNPRDKRLRLPHGETDETKVYLMPNPASCNESLHEIRHWVFNGALDGHRPEYRHFAAVVSLAEAYTHLTASPLGQEHSVRKLRDIWRARRAEGSK